MSIGTRQPPSKDELLKPRRGSLTVPIPEAPPLSLMKITKTHVLSTFKSSPDTDIEIASYKTFCSTKTIIFTICIEEI